MEVIFWIGRIVFGLILLISGLNHFIKMEKMITYAKMRKVPMPGLAVSFTGLMLLFSGIVIIGWWQVILGPALIILAIFLFFTTILMHAFWKAPAESRMNEMHFFMGNMMLFGAILIILAIV
jgi:uncharacterized membrane protein YphA (DoxX/SURF4 family)